MDEAEKQREPTLSPTWYNIYDSLLHISEETVKVEHVDEYSNKAIGETDNLTCDENIRETTYEPEAKVKFEFNNKEQLMCNTEVGVCDGKHIIKNELVEINCEQKLTDNSHFTTFGNKNEIKSRSCGVPGNEENQMNESSEVSEVTKQRPKRRNNRQTPFRNQSSDTLPRRKELVVLLEDIMLSKYNTQDSYKQLAASASSTEDKESGHHSSFKDRIVFKEDDNLDTLTSTKDTNKVLKYEITTTANSSVSDPCHISQTISTRISSVDSNNLIPNDTESLKKLYICDICNKGFYWKSSLVLHIRKHPKLYNCTYCIYKTFKKFNIDQHINSKHSKSTVFNCSYCTYKAYRKCYLDQHINSHHTKSISFNCSHCNFKTFDKSGLRGHINSQHTKSTVFTCSYCSYKAYQKYNLNQHINSQHTRITSFNCSYCNYKSFHKSALRGHINSQHIKSTVFNCSYCSYKAYVKCNLDQHINSKHTKSTSFNCPHCNYKSFYKEVLNRHVNAKHLKKAQCDRQY